MTNVCCDFLKLKSHFQFSCYAWYSSRETSANNVWLANHRSPCGTVWKKTFNFLYTTELWQHLCGHCRKTLL